MAKEKINLETKKLIENLRKRYIKNPNTLIRSI
jgi:hypothetical protein